MTPKERSIVDGLLARDNKITQEFFFTECKPLIISLIRKVFQDTQDYDEMINALYLHLMENDGRRLRTFGEHPADSTPANKGGKAASLFGWIKKTAYHLFLSIKHNDNENENRRPILRDEDGDIIDVDLADESVKDPGVNMDADTFLELAPARDRNILEMYFKQDLDADEIATIAGVDIANLYNIKKRALDRLHKLARHATGPEALCSILCEQYALDVFGIHKSLLALRDLAREQGWLEESGMALSNFGKLSSHFDLKVRSGMATLEELTAALDKAEQVIVAVDGGELTGNLVEEKLEDVFGGEVSDHTVVVLTINQEAREAALYDPAFGTEPLVVPLDQFIDAWKDSGNFALIVHK